MTLQVVAGGVAEVPVGSARRSLLLHLRDDSGGRGQGEASPLPGYSPDTPEAAAAALSGFLAGPLPAFNLEMPLPPQIAPVLTPLEVSPAAAFAVETAVLDVIGRRTGRPVWALLRADSAAAPTPVPLAALLEGESAGPLLAAARTAMTRGVRTFKVKIGRQPFREELAVLFQLRHLIGYGASLRLDANGRFPAASVRDRLLALTALHPEFVEEPTGAGAWPFLRGSPVPLALDESLQGEGGWQRGAVLVREGIARVVVLKPATMGGLFRCLELSREAVRMGAAAVITHTMDGPVALTAAAHLALAAPQLGSACGVDRHTELLAWGAVPLPWHDRNAVMPVPRPGLGLPDLSGVLG